MLELNHLSRRFGDRPAVSDVNVSIPLGQMVGVIGRSGAGKSTLLRMINRLIAPTSGRIMFDGTDVTALRGAGLRAWRANAAMVFQQFNLTPRLDVLTNVLCGRLNTVPAWRALPKIFTVRERAMAVRALDRLGMADFAFSRADQLSGGQQQRVAIARALMQEPRLVLADEPIASLDPMNARLVMEALRDINQRDGLTVLVNLHTLDIARAYCHRIIAMSAGSVVFDGTPAELTESAVHDIYGAEPPRMAVAQPRTARGVAADTRLALGV